MASSSLNHTYCRLFCSSCRSQGWSCPKGRCRGIPTGKCLEASGDRAGWRVQGLHEENKESLETCLSRRHTQEHPSWRTVCPQWLNSRQGRDTWTWATVPNMRSILREFFLSLPVHCQHHGTVAPGTLARIFSLAVAFPRRPLHCGNPVS